MCENPKCPFCGPDVHAKLGKFREENERLVKEAEESSKTLFTVRQNIVDESSARHSAESKLGFAQIEIDESRRETRELRTRLIKERAAHAFGVRNYPKRLAEQSPEIVQAEEGCAAEALGAMFARPFAGSEECCCKDDVRCGDDCRGCPVHGPLCQVSGDHDAKVRGIFHVCVGCFSKLVTRAGGTKHIIILPEKTEKSSSISDNITTPEPELCLKCKGTGELVEHNDDSLIHDCGHFGCQSWECEDCRGTGRARFEVPK